MKPDFNRRCVPRVSIPEAVVELLDFRPRLRDLSDAGVFVEDPRPVKAGRMVRLLLRLDERSRAITVWGMVRRVEEGKGMGIEFMEMSAADRALLHNFLQERSREEPGTKTDAQ